MGMTVLKFQEYRMSSSDGMNEKLTMDNMAKERLLAYMKQTNHKAKGQSKRTAPTSGKGIKK